MSDVILVFAAALLVDFLLLAIRNVCMNVIIHDCAHAPSHSLLW